MPLNLQDDIGILSSDKTGLQDDLGILEPKVSTGMSRMQKRLAEGTPGQRKSAIIMSRLAQAIPFAKRGLSLATGKSLEEVNRTLAEFEPKPRDLGEQLTAGVTSVAPTLLFASPFVKGAHKLTKIPSILRPAVGFGGYEGLKALSQGDEPVQAALSGAGSALAFGAGSKLGASLIPRGIPFAETIGSVLGGGAVGAAMSPEEEKVAGAMLGGGFGLLSPSRRAPLSSFGKPFGRVFSSSAGIKPEVFKEVEQRGFRKVIQKKYLDKEMPEQLQHRIEDNLDALEKGAIGMFEQATAPLRETQVDFPQIRGKVIIEYNKVKRNPFKGDSAQLNDRIAEGVINTEVKNLGDLLDLRRFLADELYTSNRQGVKSKFGKDVYDIFNKYLHQNKILEKADANWTTLQNILREGKKLTGETGENFLKRFSKLTGKQKEKLALLEKQVGGEPFIEDLTNWSLAQEFSTRTASLNFNPFTGFGMLTKAERPLVRGYLRGSEAIGKGLDIGQEAINVGSERLRSGLERQLSNRRGSVILPGGFTSKTYDLINSSPQNIWDAEQLKGFLKGKVSQAELDTLGVNKLQGKVSKPQILDLIKSGIPQVEVVEKGKITNEYLQKKLSQLEEDYANKQISPRDYWVEKSNLGRLRETETKFSRYQFPGGENYREVLIKAPLFQEPRLKAGLNVKQMPDGTWNLWDTKGKPGWVFNKGKKYKENLVNIMTSDEMLTAIPSFKSSHWDEPNVLAHIRMNDRVTPDGKKVLFIEELQSDWAREARKDATGPEALKLEGGFPTHPLLKNWQELALKQVLKKAVDEGYDGISWTTGEQQAQRYDLSKQVDQISYSPRDKILLIYGKGDTSPKTVRGVNIESLESHIGKDPAKKIQEQISSGVDRPTLKGIDLKIGGEWAKNLYDRQIPNILKDLTGGKIENVKLQLGEIRRYGYGGRIEIKDISVSVNPFFNFTPEIRTKIKKGLPLFSALVSLPEKKEKTVQNKFKQFLSQENIEGGKQIVKGKLISNMGIENPTFSQFKKENPGFKKNLNEINEEDKNRIYDWYFKNQPYEELGEIVGTVMYDFGFHYGNSTANRSLQETVGAKEDGVIGKETLSKVREYVKKYGEDSLAKALIHKNVTYSLTRSNYFKNKKGWTNRLVKLSKYLDLRENK